MKIHLLIPATVLILSIFSCSGSGEKNGNDSVTGDSVVTKTSYDSPDEIASAIVSFIKTDNYPGLSDLILTKDEMISAINSSNFTTEMKREKSNKAEEELKKILSDTKSGFDQIRLSGEQDGIIWDKVTYKRSSYSMNNEVGFEVMRLEIFIDFKSVEYPILVTGLIKTGAGWKLGGTMKYLNTSKAENEKISKERLQYENLVRERDAARQAALDCQAARDKQIGGGAKNRACSDLQEKMDRWGKLDKKVTEQKRILDAITSDGNDINERIEH